MITRTKTIWLIWQYMLLSDVPGQRCVNAHFCALTHLWASSPPLHPRPKVTTRLYGPVAADLPPKVAEMRRWVPYFLMMVSMNCWVVGLLPSRRMLLWNSGMRGTGWRTKSLLSMAVFLTFQRANSLGRKDEWDSSTYHLYLKPKSTQPSHLSITL